MKRAILGIVLLAAVIAGALGLRSYLTRPIPLNEAEVQECIKSNQATAKELSAQGVSWSEMSKTNPQMYMELVNTVDFCRYTARKPAR